MQQSFGCDAHYLAAWSEDRLVGALPLVRLKSRLFGDFLVSIPYVNFGGALAASDAVDEQLLKAACTLGAELGVEHIEFRERRPRASSWPARTDKLAMQLALTEDVDSQWSGLRAKLRAQIRRPRREGASVVRGGAELVNDFYTVFATKMRDLGTPVYSREFFARILDALGEQAEIVLVKVNEAVAAACLLTHFRGVTEIPWASSRREFDRVGANMLLYWAAIESAHARGSSVFDFGRSSKDSGTYRFKKQWGSEPVPLFWHYWLPAGRSLPGLNPDNPKYALAIRAWRRLPLPVANWLGPRLVRHLP